MLREIATANYAILSGNTYPGRGIVIGRTPNNRHDVQVYWIMGRSEQSRNRRFVYVQKEQLVRTEAVDPTRVKDPSLIIYNAMREHHGSSIVTNGDQTDTIFNEIGRTTDPFYSSLLRRTFEPDAPNYTPRISAMSRGYDFRIAIHSRSVDGRCELAIYRYEELPFGYGYCVHTYSGDGNPLPSFRDRPYLVPIESSIIAEVSKFFWDALNEENRVALVTKFVDVSTGSTHVHIVNRF